MNVSLRVDPASISRPFMVVTRQTVQMVALGFEAIDQYQGNSPNAVPSVFSPSFMVANGQQNSKEEFKAWVLMKGFEELVEGVKQSLVECIFLLQGIDQLYGKEIVALTLKDGKNIQTQQDLLTKITQMREECSKYHLPTLIEKTTAILGELPRVADIESINRVRRCLVHRNGIVSQTDINDTNTNVLRISYGGMRFYLNSGNEKKLAGTGSIFEKGDELNITHEPQVKEFFLDSRIALSADDFNDIVMTCSVFVNAITRLAGEYAISVINQKTNVS